MPENASSPKHLRIQKNFYRILLVSEKDSQTIALVPDAQHAQDITRMLTETIKLKEGQRFICKLGALRPDSSKAMTPGYDWSDVKSEKR
jgi:hypothetical protein